MLKYDYTIKRNEGDEIREYKPNLIPKELTDVVYIEGPNSSGKSTLLNLIALGFFGLKLRPDELNPALREKLQNLHNSDHQEVQFNIEIHNDMLATTLKSIKRDFKSTEYQVRRKVGSIEKPLSAEQFRKEYRLIYDIPNNPLERLPQLLIEIKNAQLTKGHQITALKNAIREAINGVKNSKDPKLLDSLHDKLDKQKTEYEMLKGQVQEKEHFQYNFEKFFYTKFYLEYGELLKQVQHKIKQVEQSQQSVFKEEKKESKEQAILLKSIKENVSNANTYYNEATGYLKSLLPKTEKHHLDIWLDSNCSDEINEPEVYQSLRQEADYFINFLPQLKDESDDDKINEATFLRSLIGLLNDYSHTSITIPVVNKKVDEFIDILQTEIRKFEGLITKNDNIQKCIELIESMKLCILKAISDTNEYKEVVRKHGKTIERMTHVSQSNELELMEERRDFLENKLTYYLKELAKLNIDENKVQNVLHSLRSSKEFDVYEVYTENQLFDKLNSIKSEIAGLNREIRRLDKSITMTLGEIERIEKKEPHRYQDYLDELEKAMIVVQNLERKLLVDFDEHVKKIMSPEARLENLSPLEQKYADYVAEFLAEKVRYIKHIDQNFLVKRIDVVQKEIATEEEKIIKFTDLGTGQSQGAYLEGLLSLSDNKKIIALFDEVAMMDSHTLEPIINKLRQLYEQKKLLLGIIVQKADEVKVKSLV